MCQGRPPLPTRQGLPNHAPARVRLDRASAPPQPAGPRATACPECRSAWSSRCSNGSTSRPSPQLMLIGICHRVRCLCLPAVLPRCRRGRVGVVGTRIAVHIAKQPLAAAAVSPAGLDVIGHATARQPILGGGAMLIAAFLTGLAYRKNSGTMTRERTRRTGRCRGATLAYAVRACRKYVARQKTDGTAREEHNADHTP